MNPILIKRVFLSRCSLSNLNAIFQTSEKFFFAVIFFSSSKFAICKPRKKILRFAK